MLNAELGTGMTKGTVVHTSASEVVEDTTALDELAYVVACSEIELSVCWVVESMAVPEGEEASLPVEAVEDTVSDVDAGTDIVEELAVRSRETSEEMRMEMLEKLDVGTIAPQNESLACWSAETFEMLVERTLSEEIAVKPDIELLTIS